MVSEGVRSEDLYSLSPPCLLHFLSFPPEEWKVQLFGAFSGAYRKPWYFWGVVQVLRRNVLASIMLASSVLGGLSNLHFALFLSMVGFQSLSCVPSAIVLSIFF